MKPHPRIRKSIKWGGAALTVLLAAVWCESSIRYHVVRPTSATQSMLRMGRLSFDYGHMPAQNLVILGPRATWEHRRYSGNGIHLLDVSLVSTLRCECHPYYDGWGCSFPIAAPLFATAGIWAAAWRLDVRARRPARLNLCSKCNYNRAGLAADAKCPECGALPASR